LSPPTDPQILAITLAVLGAKVEHLTEISDERHDSLLERLEERDAALQAALDRIAAALPPLVAKVEALEKARSQIVAVAAAGSVALTALAWLVERFTK
jgi:predicted metal-dependent phosphoesterase TrpH